MRPDCQNASRFRLCAAMGVSVPRRLFMLVFMSAAVLVFMAFAGMFMGVHKEWITLAAAQAAP